MAEQRDTCADCGSEIDETVCWCGTLRTDHGGFGENHSFVPMGCNCHRAMPDHTNDLRAHALHQKSKEPPDVPSITAEEAAVLCLHSLPFSHYYAMLHADNRGLLDIRSGSLTALGRAALDKHRSDRERDVRRKAIEESPLLHAALRLADIEDRRYKLDDQEFDSLDSEMHAAVDDVCAAAREATP